VNSNTIRHQLRHVTTMTEPPLRTFGDALADENLCRRPARFITESNMARLDKVRAAYDPDGRFHSWMGGV
jgi:FAD/FMN-containing dehydrogenase